MGCASVNDLSGREKRMLSAPWTHDVAGLVNGTDSEFHRTVVPLLLMIKLTYTATFGVRRCFRCASPPIP